MTGPTITDRQAEAASRRARLGPWYRAQVAAGRTASQIAPLAGVSAETVRGDLRALGLPLVPPGDPRQVRGIVAAQAARRVLAQARRAAGVKVCATSRRLLPLECFSARAGRVDGRNSECRACQAERSAAIRAPRRLVPFDAWRLKCCGGYLAEDPVAGWWRCVHRPHCRDRWQPWLPKVARSR